jgi:hypothetical protein
VKKVVGYRAARVVGASAFEASGGVRQEGKVAFLKSLGGVQVEAVEGGAALVRCHALAAEYVAHFGFEVRRVEKELYEVVFSRKGVVVLKEGVEESLFSEA